MTHCSVCGLDDERLLLPFASKLLHIVLKLRILRWEDPGFGNEAVFLRLAFNHPERRRRNRRKNSQARAWTRRAPGGQCLINQSLIWCCKIYACDGNTGFVFLLKVKVTYLDMFLARQSFRQISPIPGKWLIL